jgi:hypothetical protein
VSSKRPDIEQLEGYLKAMPASLQGPDTRRLEAILAGVRRSTPSPRPRVRNRHTLWWIVLALSTGMATAAIWHQSRKLAAKPVVAVQPSPLAGERPEELRPPADPAPSRESEPPLERQDLRFIPR